MKEWKVLGTAVPRPAGHDLVTGAHQYPSDIVRPEMLYGKILRPPAYGAKLISVDLAPAKAMTDVIVVRDDAFVGVAAPNSSRAERALDEISEHGEMGDRCSPQPSSKAAVRLSQTERRRRSARKSFCG